MAIEETSRILALLSLLSSRRMWTGRELAQRLDTTGRTVRRDIDRLRLLGYEITGARGAAGGYQLAAGADLPPLFLDDDEAVAVVVALLAGRSSGMDDATTRALAKVHHVMPSRLRRRLDAVHAGVRTVVEVDAPQVDPRAVAALAEATRDRLRVTFDYQARDGQRSARRVEPHRLVTPGHVWYLVAYDLDRDDWRVFRIDRVTALVTTGHTFVERSAPGNDPAALVGRAIARTPMAHHAVVHLAVGIAELRAARPALLVDRITAVDRGHCAVALAAEDLDVLVRQIVELLQVGAGATVDASVEVRTRVADLAAALRSAVDGPGG